MIRYLYRWDYGAAYTTRVPSIGHFFFKCKMGYEYHRRFHGTRVLSPWRKNPGYRDEEGKQETRKTRGRETIELSGGVARVSTVDHRGKLASAESRPQNAAAPPAAAVAAAAIGSASTLLWPLASLSCHRPYNPSRAEPPPRPGIEISLASVGLEGVGRVYAAATVDRIVCAHAQPNTRQLRH